MKPITKRNVAWTGMTIALALLLVLASQGLAAQPEAQQEESAVSEEGGVLAPSSTLISYQGTLADKTGNPINGTVPMEFALYDDPTAQDLSHRKWGPETQTVQVANGLFHVLLGSVQAIDPANLRDGALYLNVKVNGESLTPRELMVSVVHAVQATEVAGDLDLRGGYATGVRDVYGEDGNAQIHMPGGSNSGNIYFNWHHGGSVYFGGGDALADVFIAQGGNVGIGTTNPTRQLYLYRNSTGPNGIVVENGLASDTGNPAQIDFLRTAIGSTQWASVGMDHSGRDFFIWVNGGDRLNITESGTTRLSGTLDMTGHSVVNCGALTEANLQTLEEQAAGGSDRFDEGDVLCWGIDQLEECTIANDRLVQAVADSAGRPIVIGAEVIKVLGPVKRGDILVASSVPGYAMVNNDPLSGSVIAQALVDFDGEQGIIKAMIRKW